MKTTSLSLLLLLGLATLATAAFAQSDAPRRPRNDDSRHRPAPVRTIALAKAIARAKLNAPRARPARRTLAATKPAPKTSAVAPKPVARRHISAMPTAAAVPPARRHSVNAASRAAPK